MPSGHPFVSVVTPFYNTAEYLEQCIEAVLSQTLEDFEYILVDNHSTDGGGDIAAQHAKRDSRIRFFRTDRFLSQCDNFNFAMRQISSESTYCKMVLADDWLFPQCLAEMTALADANPTIGLVSSYSIADRTVWGAGLPVERSVLSGREAARMHLVDGCFLFGNNSTVMYRSDTVREASSFYDESSVFFDTDAAFRILASSDFGFVHQILSYLRVHPTSITERTKTYGPIAADTMIALHRHGPTFMSADEQRARLRPTERWFYEGLGRQRLREVFSAPDEDYWAYQRWYLDAAGQPLRRSRVWRGAARALLLSLAPTSDQMRRLRRRLRAVRA